MANPGARGLTEGAHSGLLENPEHMRQDGPAENCASASCRWLWPSPLPGGSKEQKTHFASTGAGKQADSKLAWPPPLDPCLLEGQRGG